MSEQGLHAAIKSNVLKVRDLEKVAKVLGVPLNYFFVENNNIKIKGQMHNGTGDIISSDNRDLIVENELLKKEVKGLKREIELLKEMNEMLKNK